MTYLRFPLTNDPWQVSTVDVPVDGLSVHARTEIRFLPGAGQWVFSLRDQATGALLVNQIPLVCSYGEVNDLFLPFRHLREGRGLGSLILLRSADGASAPDPGEGNLTDFILLIGDTYES